MNETAEAAVEYEEVTKTRKKTVRLPLTVGGPGLVLPSMTAEQLKVGCTPGSAFTDVSHLGNDSCSLRGVLARCPIFLSGVAPHLTHQQMCNTGST